MPFERQLSRPDPCPDPETAPGAWIDFYNPDVAPLKPSPASAPAFERQIDRVQAERADPRRAGRATADVDTQYDVNYAAVEKNFGNAVFREHGPPPEPGAVGNAAVDGEARRRKLAERMLKRLGRG